MKKDFFEHFADEFSNGDTVAITRRFEFPSAIYQGENLCVFHSPGQMHDALCKYRNRLCESRYSSSKAVVAAVGIRRGDQQIFWIDWSHFDVSGDEIEKTSVKYFCCVTPNYGHRIQLGEYIDLHIEKPTNDSPHQARFGAHLGL